MNDTKAQSLLNAETHRFNENASRLLIQAGRDELHDFFASIGHECCPCGSCYKMRCPICRESFVWLSTARPIAYPIYWGCYSKACPSSQAKRYVKNLLGLVRACLGDCTMPVAYTAIADFLGYPCSYDITNLDETDIGKARRIRPPIVTPSPQLRGGEPIFVVTRKLKALFDRAGVEAIVDGQTVPNDRRVIVIEEPWEWDFLSPERVRREAQLMAISPSV